MKAAIKKKVISGLWHIKNKFKNRFYIWKNGEKRAMRNTHCEDCAEMVL